MPKATTKTTKKTTKKATTTPKKTTKKVATSKKNALVKKSEIKKTLPSKTVPVQKLNNAYHLFGLLILLLVACLVFVTLFMSLAFQSNLDNITKQSKDFINNSFIEETFIDQEEAPEPDLPNSVVDEPVVSEDEVIQADEDGIITQITDSGSSVETSPVQNVDQATSQEEEL